MILVVAGDQRQYDYWCKQNELDPRNRRQVVRYSANPDSWRGYSAITVVFVGTWKKVYSDEFMYLATIGWKAQGFKMFVAEDADPIW